MWGLRLTTVLVLQINLKNSWAKVIDTITVKNAGKTDLTNFVVCYPDSLASRIALLKVCCLKPPEQNMPHRRCYSSVDGRMQLLSAK